MRDMSIYEERDGLLAEVAEGLALVADLQTGLVKALAEIERLRGGREIEPDVSCERCICSGDSTGEDIDIRPDCPAHEYIPVDPAGWPPF